MPVYQISKYLLVLLAMLVQCSTLSAQGEYLKWYFGNKAGLDFSSSPPTVLTNGQMIAGEGCASISDAMGNLLFYTNGCAIYNAQHNVMPNGAALMGNLGTTQSALIIKRPGSNTYYYVLSLSVCGNSTLWSSDVDMTLVNGTGSVTVKNYSVANYLGERVISIPHCNGKDFWILTHAMFNANFQAYLVTSAGISIQPVVSSVGTNHTNQGDCGGNLKYSQRAGKVGIALTASGVIEVFDFDPATGTLSNPVSLTGLPLAYGVEFSPDGSKLYGTCAISINTTTGVMNQWDLCAGSPSAIAASHFSVPTSYNLGGMQLAPDGKIYVAETSSMSIGAINNPNMPGNAMGYSLAAITLSPGVCGANLPNYTVQESKSPTPPFTFTVSNSYGCQGVAFTAPPFNTVVGCPPPLFQQTGLHWDFGDPSSGSANTSTLSNPIHAYTSTGNYTVTMVVQYGCIADTVRQLVTITQPCILVNTNAITCATLGSATVNPTGGVGPYSFTWMPGNHTGSVATGLAPGAYTITVFDAGVNLSYTAYANLAPSVPFSGNVDFAPSLRCFGATNATAAVSGLSGGSGQQTFKWTDGSHTLTTAAVSSLGAGVWTVTVADLLSGCQFFHIFYVAQPPPITISFSASPPACAGSTAVLTGMASGGTGPYTYGWAGGPAEHSMVISEGGGGLYSYTLAVLDSNLCSHADVTTFSFTPVPIISLASVSVCPLETGTLVAGGAGTYTWSNNTTGNMLADNPLATTLYHVTGSVNGCTAAATASIVLRSTPQLIITNNSPLCEGALATLGVTGGAAWQWMGPSGFVSSSASVSLNAVTLQQAGIYSVTVTGVNSCTASATSTVIVYPSPDLSVIHPTVCTSQDLVLSAVSASASTFVWTGPNSFSSTAQHPTLSLPPVNAGGSYTVVATSMHGCSANMVVNALVVPPPLLTSVSGATLCAQPLNGSPATVTLSAHGAGSYTLTVPPVLLAQSDLPDQPPFFLSVQPPYGSGIVYATATLVGSNGVCTSTLAPTFTIIPNPTVSVQLPHPVICAGESFTYTGAGASAYTWYASMPGFTVLPNGTGAVVRPSGSTQYTVVGSHLGCRSAAMITGITVNPIPSLFITPAVAAVCPGDSVLLSAEGTATHFTWTPALHPVSGAQTFVKPMFDQVYTVTGSAIGCTNQARAEVKVLPLPQPRATIPKSTFCLNELVTLTGSGAETYHWIGPQNNHLDGSPVSFVMSHPAFAGEFTLVAADSNGCRGRTTILFSALPLPNGYLAGLADRCAPFCGTYTFVPLNSFSVLSTWFLLGDPASPQQLVTGPGEERLVTACFKEKGTYLLRGELEDRGTGCRSTQTMEVNAFESPDADFDWWPTEPVEGQDEVHFANRSGGGEQTRWDWAFAHDILLRPKEERVTVMFPNHGTYPVALVVANRWGCSDTAIRVVRIGSEFAIYIPNAFTPNDDPRNTVFRAVTRGVSRYQMQLFDRWGERLFVTENTEEGWDGTFKGAPCPQGVYVWKILLTTVAGEAREYKGVVTLLR
jgi:gliding motility-associated-like protein